MTEVVDVDFVDSFSLEVEGGFGLAGAVGDRLAFGIVAVGLVEGFVVFGLEKLAEIDLDDRDIGGVDAHSVHVGIGHLEHVSSPYSSP